VFSSPEHCSLLSWPQQQQHRAPSPEKGKKGSALGPFFPYKYLSLENPFLRFGKALRCFMGLVKINNAAARAVRKQAAETKSFLSPLLLLLGARWKYCTTG
jgi:hypothetical protein